MKQACAERAPSDLLDAVALGLQLLDDALRSDQMQRTDSDEVRSRLTQQLLDLARHREVALIKKLVVKLALGFRIVKALLVQLVRGISVALFPRADICRR